ncbi:N-acetylneuraminate synthase [Aliiglaciecola litoralis]|uniref:N-acetylneuraminate synthase n=1 Tax=Aliiglaciecola litoralis TaxID=582857 RepID=A0ABN1LKB5_9ALTE
MAVKIIAEAGVNHNGDIALAYKLIDAAKKAGADAVKFQTFTATDLVTAEAQQCDYQARNTQRVETQLAMLQRLELSRASHIELQQYCQKIGIEFLSSAFDSSSLCFLVDELNLNTLKIASGEITNGPFLLEHARTGCDLIISTGMSTLQEVQQALAVLAFGLTYSDDQQPCIKAFNEAFNSSEGQRLLKQKVTVLHCTTEYPAPMGDINLRAMDTLRDTFDLAVGYSDHSEGIAVSIAAVARDAQVIEKHFTLDKNMSGPDHKASLDPAELTTMVNAIRAIELALGDGVKKPFDAELQNQQHARKSLVCKSDIKRGDIFSSENVTVKRPGDGMSPSLYWQLLGKTATRDYLPGHKICESS